MGKGFRVIYPKVTYNSYIHQRNESQNHSKIPFHTLGWLESQKWITKGGEDVEKPELSYMGDGM